MSSDRRWPQRVYGVGDEPDARFTLANERTFLAWVRTALALLACGIALEAFDLPIEPTLRLSASIVLLLVGTLTPFQAWFGWMRVERMLRLNRPLPSPAIAGPVGVGVFAAGVLVIVGLLVR